MERTGEAFWPSGLGLYTVLFNRLLPHSPSKVLCDIGEVAVVLPFMLTFEFKRCSETKFPSENVKSLL